MIMSLLWGPEWTARSAYSTVEPFSTRSSFRSSMETTSRVLSGSQPRPEGEPGTSATVSVVPSGAMARTWWRQ
jgi:hypothetical protein